jgi:hypothetical protein
MRLHNRSLSKVSLKDILRRRKTDLKIFLNENGIVTYELLLERCKSMGVVPPEESEFLDSREVQKNILPTLSSPAEGLIVLKPLAIVSEKTGDSVIDSNSPSEELDESFEESLDADKNKKKKNKSKQVAV